VAAVIRNASGNILVAKRNPRLSNGGKWEFPGGKLGVDEIPEECLKREILEELGIEIEVKTVFHVVNSVVPDKSILLIAYNCRFRKGEFTLSDHDEIRWLSPAEILNLNLSEPDIPVARKLIAEAGESKK
ncbi:MAG: (deoxy)nucleoside triphosphate pyrophosphohydrolase, partial [Calditrichia bacterium]